MCQEIGRFLYASGDNYARHIHDGPMAKAYVRRLGNTAHPRRAAAWQNGSPAIMQFRHPQKWRTCKSLHYHGRGKCGALRLDKAPVNSESGDGRNDQHGHRSGGAVRPGDGPLL
jgi:hypothetical protein